MGNSLQTGLSSLCQSIETQQCSLPTLARQEVLLADAAATATRDERQVWIHAYKSANDFSMTLA